MPRRGLVLGGGGALGAYQAAALRALREHGLAFEVISATSIGTLHALAWNIGDLILEIDQHWRKHVVGLKPFDLRRVLRGKNPFRFRGSLDDVFDAYRGDYPKGGDPVEILVALTELETASLKIFSTSDHSYTRAERELFHKASTVLPHLGITPIEIRGRRYYDGGYLDSLPIRPLEGRGLDEIWVIPLAPVRVRARGAPAPPRDRRPLHSRWPNPYVGPLLGLVDQLLTRRSLAPGVERLIVVAPERLGEARALFRTSHALTFSRKNIERLLARGYRDGERACRSYLA